MSHRSTAYSFPTSQLRRAAGDKSPAPWMFSRPSELAGLPGLPRHLHARGCLTSTVRHPPSASETSCWNRRSRLRTPWISKSRISKHVLTCAVKTQWSPPDNSQPQAVDSLVRGVLTYVLLTLIRDETMGCRIGSPMLLVDMDSIQTV